MCENVYCKIICHSKKFKKKSRSLHFGNEMARGHTRLRTRSHAGIRALRKGVVTHGVRGLPPTAATGVCKQTFHKHRIPEHVHTGGQPEARGRPAATTLPAAGAGAGEGRCFCAVCLVLPGGASVNSGDERRQAGPCGPARTPQSAADLKKGCSPQVADPPPLAACPQGWGRCNRRPLPPQDRGARQHMPLCPGGQIVTTRTAV